LAAIFDDLMGLTNSFMLNTKMGQHHCLIHVNDFAHDSALFWFSVAEAYCAMNVGFFNAQNERSLSGSV
jgi:hypothetical protein